MTVEQARELKIDRAYLFTLRDGRTVRRRGSWLATTDNTGWKLNLGRIAMVLSYE